MQKGEKVSYVPYKGASPERGVVKSVHDGWAFVVYKCNEDWDNYENYTGIRTPLDKLIIGWLEDCSHYFVPNDESQMECLNCGLLVSDAEKTFIMREITPPLSEEKKVGVLWQLN